MRKLEPMPVWKNRVGIALIAVAIWLLALRGCDTFHKPTPERTPPQLTTERFVSPLPNMLRTMDELYAERYSIPLFLSTQIRHAARTHRIPLRIAYGLVYIESRFYAPAVSHAGAIGLTQVMPRTGWLHCRLSEAQLFLPIPNLHCGFSYLRMLQDRYSDWPTSLAAYNVGPHHLRQLPNTGARYTSMVMSAHLN